MSQLGLIITSLQNTEYQMFDNAINSALSNSISVISQFGVSREARQVQCVCEMKIEQEEVLLLSISGECTVTISPESWSAIDNGTLEQKSITLSKEWAAHILTILIGAIRGMFVVRTANTPFSLMVIPLINPFDLIENDFVFSFPETSEEA
jgi:hypothetical protein